MRILFTTILFFFGPMVIIFALRNGFLLLRLWIKNRQEKAEHEVIDVTPKASIAPTSRPFLVIYICISLAIFSYAWVNMSENDVNPIETDTRIYVPAYIDPYGNLVKSHFEEAQ